MVPYHCPRCRAALGRTDGRTLHVGGAVIRRPVTLECAACGKARPWKPVAAAQPPKRE